MAIASLGPSVTDTLVALGLSDRIAVTDRESWTLYSSHIERRDVAVVEGFEELRRAVREMRIDLVIALKSALRGLGTDLGVDTVVLDEPRTVFDIVSDVWSLGAIVGRASEASELCRAMMEILSSYQGSLPPLRTYVEAVTREGITGLGPLTPAGSVIEFLGLRNVGSSIGLESFEPDVRALRILNPSIILIDIDPDTGLDTRALSQWFMDRGMSGIEAVKRGRIVVFTRELTCFGYSFVVRTVPKIVHRVLELIERSL